MIVYRWMMNDKADPTHTSTYDVAGVGRILKGGVVYAAPTRDEALAWGACLAEEAGRTRTTERLAKGDTPELAAKLGTYTTEAMVARGVVYALEVDACYAITWTKGEVGASALATPDAAPVLDADIPREVVVVDSDILDFNRV